MDNLVVSECEYLSNESSYFIHVVSSNENSSEQKKVLT